MSAHHPIAIVGAGLGGLALARILRLNGIEAAVFDLDASPTARTQGGMLDIHEDSGQVALRAAGLFDEFTAAVHPGGEATRVLDKSATALLDEPGDGDDRGRPEVNRRALRDILLASLPDGAIRWGAKVTGVRSLGDGRHELAFADGPVVTTDLLVGADGAWSRVRRLLTDATPVYSGLSFVEANLHDADARHPGAAEVVGGAMLFALGEDRGFLGHRDPDGGLHVYCALRTPEGWAADFVDSPEARAELLTRFEDWDDRLRSLVTDADGALVARPVHALPIGTRWERVPGVTLIGDAAHLMSPFAGEGANLALFDASELAVALVGHPGDVEKALAVYEESMFPRAERSARDSVEGLDLCFRADAPHGLVAVFQGAGQ
ncbi:NAD(P)/FAD-dependent oxidoreductase [Umezawaea sp. Da 62-37]|uniref:FAD-dependent oxidoreductase n=1 Tax=Umezawaea sp. Da 62-37 TaxID=3075927 RepID=UPI0028F6DF1C|nr:NAD(P)/FAD-dependent oxidoreductase [Umezawaea sp. Da 62-37]WNV86406.1 NAD(P)/FAD-dependent oxidoreductase [Umezawaea sp. Da 62-37]